MALTDISPLSCYMRLLNCWQETTFNRTRRDTHFDKEGVDELVLYIRFLLVLILSNFLSSSATCSRTKLPSDFFCIWFICSFDVRFVGDRSERGEREG